ncbi:hypothetical protein HPP92_020711 [Vanilla planifolia]|uniref:Uncharacterized protein n=1 Tax=Vanilla planifolia TaxID=51239 RepID=A0A835UIQ7_VANPL|nr:hypothetical protein HPP92_020711 [Vanilla planifolia]
MGNCAFRGNGEATVVRLVTSAGGVMELPAPVTAESVANGFPGHAVFPSGDRYSSRPLLHTDELVAGQIYHLLPIQVGGGGRDGYRLPSLAAPYRVSFDPQGFLEAGPGVWKVKLAISAAHLAEILSQEARTEALIERVRAAAMCGAMWKASPVGSDLWSLASSRKSKPLPGDSAGGS